ncbi:50S ribosomal protein L33 [Candidatus Vidania fulgoroideorum]
MSKKKKKFYYYFSSSGSGHFYCFCKNFNKKFLIKFDPFFNKKFKYIKK